MNNRTALEKQIDFINVNFNFAKVNFYMKENGWRWGDGATSRIPDVTELKVEALRLITSLTSSSNVGVSCGGFRASNKGDQGLKLEFLSKNDKTVIEEVIAR